MNLWSEIRKQRSGAKTRRRLRDLSGTLVVVTGGGSGIGRESALAFAAEGATVVVVDRNLETAQQTVALINELAATHSGATGHAAHAYEVDVADEERVQRLASKVRAEHGVPDVVVNNAGIGYSGTFTQTPPDMFAKVMDVNFWGVVYGCRAFIPLMVDRGVGGHIVNVSSAAAFTPQKLLSAYATSKVAVFMFSDCLRGELAEHGIGVSTICPGVIHTNIVSTTGFAGVSAEQEAALQRDMDRLYARRNYTPDRVARQIVKAVKSNKSVQPVTPEARLGYVLNRAVPGAMRVFARFGLD